MSNGIPNKIIIYNTVSSRRDGVVRLSDIVLFYRNSQPPNAAGYGGREPGARTLSWDTKDYLREIFTGTNTVFGKGLSQKSNIIDLSFTAKDKNSCMVFLCLFYGATYSSAPMSGLTSLLSPSMSSEGAPELVPASIAGDWVTPQAASGSPEPLQI